jgi:isoleucyl-tRNA synthetase
MTPNGMMVIGKYQLLQRFVVVDLSNFYFDTAKDRLYVGGKDSYTRRSCQTVLAAHLLTLVRSIAPVLPHLAEDAWSHLPFVFYRDGGLQAETVFEAGWPSVDDKWHSFSERLAFWTTLLQVRGEVNRVIEQARAGKLVGASLDGKVYLYVSAPDLQQSLTSLSGSNEGVDALHRIFLTSQVPTHSFP